MPKSFAQLLNSRLNTVLQIIRENQYNFAERQKAEEAEIEHVLSDGYKFKKRGNEERHKHNVKVMSILKEASDELSEEEEAEARLKSVKSSYGWRIHQRRNRGRLMNTFKNSIASDS